MLGKKLEIVSSMDPGTLISTSTELGRINEDKKEACPRCGSSGYDMLKDSPGWVQW